jgi:ubiquinone/menaquinone biosynthesis C-methylase UbiE
MRPPLPDRAARRSTLYRFTQKLAAPGAAQALHRLLMTCLEKMPSPGKCLDVGCGPDSWLWSVGLDPVGVDLRAHFAEAFRRQGGEALVACAAALPFGDGSFDSVWSCGLLHHLPDDAAHRAVEEMQRVTRRGGSTVIFDAVLPRSPWQRPLAGLIRRLDGGAWMRSQQALEALLADHDGWQTRRVTYAHTGLEGLLCTRRIC